MLVSGTLWLIFSLLGFYNFAFNTNDQLLLIGSSLSLMIGLFFYSKLLYDYLKKNAD